MTQKTSLGELGLNSFIRNWLLRYSVMTTAPAITSPAAATSTAAATPPLASRCTRVTCVWVEPILVVKAEDKFAEFFIFHFISPFTQVVLSHFPK
ncbi:hypothetical protein PS664_04002 [Pseudomonas fluorescens]|nr:hypothetical protein PS664_04002 [Pseudomonas fluorescens]